ncbi:MAG: adenine phosphoribosyltransferase [Myxococcales bacterium]|nr:adenine phosphoribosyltransferase [Myxococcales bacterium]MDH3484099.1 adenine phosphoribosyltransferase [Myxococcales bacterium]
MSDNRIDYLRSRIRDVPDFPKEGILFKDITPLLADVEAFRTSIDLIAERLDGEHLDVVIGIESRGFMFGAALADKLGVGFVPVRKPGKLPAATYRAEYELEYGTDALEIHQDALRAGQRVVIVDDLIATGGTAKATGDLVERCGAEVASFVFLINLRFLKGEDKLAGYRVISLLDYK